MKETGGRIVLWAVLVVFWLMLTPPVSLQEALTGAMVAALIAFLPLAGNGRFGELAVWPRRLLHLLWFFLIFLWAVVRSNLDVAYRVLHPKLPINPGIVRVRTGLTSSVGRLLLANSITLTPGTITVDMRGPDLFIHWICVDTACTGDDSLQESTRKIVGSFEKHLEVIFG